MRRQDEHDYDDEEIDPELRLRTVRTAASAIAESIRSEQRQERRKTKRNRFFRRATEKKRPSSSRSGGGGGDGDGTPSTEVPGERRNVYVNFPLSHAELDGNGEPTVRYERNKVRTTKYTIITFIPKNLYEQFRRVANLFFLTLVVLQLFPIFGAASGAIAALPLAFILTVTAIKDAVEDYRRATLDEEVNTSAATKLGSWRNVNQPKDPRSWFEKLLGLNKPGRVTKGVRRLRDKEAGEAGDGMRVMLQKAGDNSSTTFQDDSTTSFDLDDIRNPSRRQLEDIQSVDSHSYPPASLANVSSKTSFSDSSTQVAASQVFSKQPQPSGVIDWRRRTGGSARWERTLWKKLEVGDIVLLRDNDQVPADIVVLSTSDPDGMCYLETKNLDGETNLKPRKSVKATSNITSEDDLERSSFYLDSEPPHQNLYVYHGVLRYKDPGTGEQRQEPVSINELLLRGCAIRNTQWIIGLVVFTGADTKIMLNGGATPSKRSKIEKETNFNVIVNFIVLLAMCTISAVFNGLEDAKTGTSAEFFEIDSDATDSHILNALITFVSCLIAFQNIVPISLYISIEIVKTIQAYFISQDVDMYYEPFDTPCVPKTWNISDDLGQIEYVFSDKTGTLTQNVMEFQKCSVHGVSYGEGVTEAQKGAALRDGGAGGAPMDGRDLAEKLDALKQQMLSTMERSFKNRYLQVESLTLVSPKLAQDLADRDGAQRGHLIAFFRALALCHTVLADKPDPRDEPFHLEYKAESPDEAALVAAARDVGFPFVRKTKDGMDIEVMGQMEHWTTLKVLEFNSTRKRMSTVMRAPDGRLILYCKGADSVIYARLAQDHDPELKEATARDMETFANSGLRTLCIAYRWLTEEEYLTWCRTYDAAANAIENRDEELDKANELIEHSLLILGATALEDKLQEGVPEAIETLHRAGIKLWILTGDKLQTAIEIGYSCNLLKSDMELMIISAESFEDARGQIEAGLNKIASVLGPPSFDPRKRGFFPGAQAAFAVVIDGDTLRHALTPELKELFLNLGTQCETVVCCRVSPAQKALTVKLVKDGRNAMTLSIGDGANDVAMIQEANIGCGLFGLEGSQAAMSADYAFGQFRFLTKLLIVHGRWSYQRVADMHSNFFYKNVIWTFAMFWFLPFNNFDATYLYQYTFILLYNLVFTSLPVIVLGAFDQDINAKAALAFPQLYVRGIRGLEYTKGKFWAYMSDGLYQSAVVFFMPYMIWIFGLPISWTGKTIDSLADFGTTVAVAAILAANTYVGMNTHYWTIMTWIVVFGSTIVMMLWIVVYSFFFSSDFINEVEILFGGIQFWAAIVFSATVALAPKFFVKFASSAYYPLDKEIVREMWVQGDLKDQLGIKHRKEKKRGGGDLEATPMFLHNRNGSELSLHHGTPYEPAMTSSPGATGNEGRPTYLDTPPIGERERYEYISPDANHLAPGARRPSPDHRYDYIPQDANHLAPGARGPSRQMAPSPDQARYDYSPHDANHLAPGARGPNRQMAPSPASYYSASDIPPPSPLPSPKYRYADGTVTSTPPPPSRRTSVATARPMSPPMSPRALQVPYNTRPQPPQEQYYEMGVRNSPGPHSPPRSPHSPSYDVRARSPPRSPHSPTYDMRARSPPRSPHEMGARSPPRSPHTPTYEMGMRSPPPQHRSPPHSPSSPSYQPYATSQQQGRAPPTSYHQFERSASEASYATAHDDFFATEGDVGASGQGHLAPGDVAYDGYYDDRRASAVSWQGGRAI